MLNRKILCFTVFLILFTTVFQAGAITLKIASQAPKNSDWDFALKEVASEWSKISNGRVKLRIYSGGIAGDEDDMIRKMRLGQLDGAIISGVGLNKINPQLILLSLPMFVRNSDELDFLLGEMGNDFESLLTDKNYALIGWQFLGWIHFFSKEPVYFPADLKAQKISVTQGDLVLQSVWQSMGFQIIPSSMNEVMIGLQTGRIEAFYAPAILAASNQWFAQASYMTDIPLSPLLAALIINSRSWNKVPEQYREELMQATRKVMVKIIKQTKELEDKALSIMKDNGLEIVRLNQNQVESWRKLFYDSREVLVGNDGAISTELYNKAARILDDYRSEND
jgi:TRAP-type transport system periplasmic protein